MLKKSLALNFLTFALCLSMNAQTAVVKKTAETGAAAEIRRQSFEKVWTTINEKHYDPTFGGVDWKRMREIYEPKALAAQSDNEFHQVLNQMLGELKLSHFNIFPPSKTSDGVTAANVAGGGTIGIELKMIDGRAVISRVEKDSTAERAGLKNGFVIEKIDGKTVKELLAPTDKMLADRKENDRIARLYREKTLGFFLDGKPDSIAQIEIADAADKPQIIQVKRHAAKIEMSQAMGNFPPQPVVFESKILDGNVGYIRFSMWVMPQMSKIREAVRSMKNQDGIIFDLRGNPGGIGGMATGVAGLLVSEQTSLGSMKSRASSDSSSIRKPRRLREKSSC